MATAGSYYVIGNIIAEFATPDALASPVLTDASGNPTYAAAQTTATVYSLYTDCSTTVNVHNSQEGTDLPAPTGGGAAINLPVGSIVSAQFGVYQNKEVNYSAGSSSGYIGATNTFIDVTNDIVNACSDGILNYANNATTNANWLKQFLTLVPNGLYSGNGGAQFNYTASPMCLVIQYTNPSNAGIILQTGAHSFAVQVVFL